MTMVKKYDRVFLATILILVVFGFIILASASLGLAARTDKNSYFTLLKQVALGGLGICLFIITSKIHYKKWKKIALPLFLFSFALSFLVFVPQLNFEHGGAKRWLSLGFFSFQPSELLKFSFIIYLSCWLSQKQKQVPSFKKGFLPFLVIVAFVGINLIFQPDIGTLGVITITGALMFFLAGGKFTQIGLTIILGLVMLALLIFAKPYLMSRIDVFLNSNYDSLGAGYQTNQAKIAMGSGGLWGKGLGNGLSKFNYLPEPTGDSIFAIIGEELGFAGSIFLIILFIFFFLRATRIALGAPDLFGRLLVSGIAIMIMIQVFVNMCAVVGLIPLTGLPLIFISQGGSSLALTLAATGIILNVSKYSN